VFPDALAAHNPYPVINSGKEPRMSILSFIETGLTLLGIGGVIGLWIYAARRAAPREVMLLIGAALIPSGRRTRPDRAH
jgi:hypothetical protein